MATTTSSRTPPLSPRRTNNTQQTNNSTATRSSSSKQSISQRRTSSPPPMAMSMSSSLSSLPSPQSSPSGRPSTSSSISSGRRQQQTSSPAPPLSPPVTTKKGVLKRSSLASSSSSCRTPQSSPVSPSPSSLAAPMISSNGNNHKMSGRRRRVAISPPPEEDSRRRRQQQQQQTAMVEKEDDSATESTLEESNDLSLIAGTTTTSTAIISATARTTTTTTTMSTTGSKIRPPIGNASSPTVVSRAAAVALSTTTTPTAATTPTKQNHSSPPPRIYYEVTEFHQCIVAKDWPQLEKALHKYNGRYYKRKREQAQRRKEKQQLLLQQQQQQQQQEAQQQQQDSHSSLGDGSGSGPKSPGSLDVSLFMIRTPSASSSTTNNNRNSTRRALNVLKLLPQTMSFLSPRSGSHRPDDEAEGDHEEDEKMISPLLKVDEDGRTPLHLAFLYEGCPEAIVLDLLRKDRLAATQPDHAGQLALHVAMTHRQHYRVLDKLINAYPNAMKQKDLQGRTPIGYAIELAREAQEEKEKEVVLTAARAAGAENDDDLSSFSPEHSLRSPPFYHWATPRTPAEKAWQFDQMAIWSAVEFILRDLMRRKKSVIPSEHILLVDALEGGAPPKVIHRLISTTDKYLLGDDDFAGSALALCIDRQYPLDTIEYLVDYFGHDGDGSTILSDYTQKALTTHYRLGCQSLTLGMPAFGNEIIDWNKKMHRSNNNSDSTSTSTSIRSSSSNNNSTDDDEKKEEEPQQQQLQEGSTNDQEFLSGASAQCREWWSILKYLLLFSAYGKKKVEASNSNNKDIPNDGILRDMHLVHAALAIPATQPSLVQLLLVLFPEARNELCPTYKALPIHLACTRWHYDVLRNDKDKSMEKVLKTMFLKADKEQVLYRHSGRLPLHMALTVGQSWGFVKPFVSMEKKSVGMRDPHTKLFPFQLAAMKISSKNLAMLLRHQYTPSEWRTTPPSEKKAEFARARDTQDRRQIGTIYELLRRHPDAIAGKYLVRDSFKVTGLVRGAGPISSHYLSWAYHRGTNGWRLNPTNVKPLRDSIVNGYIAKPLAGWWDQLRKLIWEKTPSDSMPEKTDGFLLHAALYNSDTPPTIIELLLALFPMAATQPIPGTRIYPLHIAAGTAVYQPQTFEVPYAMDNMQLTLNAYKGAVRLTVNGQLPIHICLSRGKTWKEVRPLVKRDPKMLLVEDGISKLVPFQLMATFRITSANNILRFAAIAEKQTRSIEMEDLSVVERAKTLRDVKRNFDLHVLSTIYEILRRAPSAMIRHIACSSGSTVCDVVSTVSSVTNDDIDFDSNKFAASPGGKNNMAILDQYLKTVQETPAPGPKKSLSSYLDLRGAPGGGGSSLISSPSALETSMAGRGLSNILAGGGERNPRGGGMPGREASLRSLTISRSNGALYEDYVKPVYDDADVMSNSMGGASMNSSGGASTSSPMPRHSPSTSTATTPGSSVRRSARRGTKKDRNNPRLPINLPDLHLDD